MVVYTFKLSSYYLYLFNNHRKPGKDISLLVPFRPDVQQRIDVWNWLRQYWENELPGAEIIIGEDEHVPFCKTAAVNNAFKKSSGKIVVILDADCYIAGSIIVSCAKNILAAQAHNKKLWYVPYRNFYRLKEEITSEILKSDPKKPLRIEEPPDKDSLESPASSSYGHWYGALIQIMPREAFKAANGMDERFNGWGGEDQAFMTAVDTLYGKHRTTRNGVFHLWHPSNSVKVDVSRSAERLWQGQSEPGTNNKLATKYEEARGRVERMHKLTREQGFHERGSRRK